MHALMPDTRQPTDCVMSLLLTSGFVWTKHKRGTNDRRPKDDQRISEKHPITNEDRRKDWRRTNGIHPKKRKFRKSLMAPALLTWSLDSRKCMSSLADTNQTLWCTLWCTFWCKLWCMPRCRMHESIINIYEMYNAIGFFDVAYPFSISNFHVADRVVRFG